jgi:hypothetical protein
MEFPSSITRNVLLKSLLPGKVIKAPTLFPDGQTAPKRLIVLSRNNTSTLLAVTTTSNKFAPTRYYALDDIYIAPNSEICFELPTYVQLNRIIEISFDRIEVLFKDRTLDFLGEITAELLAEIYAGINASEQIELRYIDRIKKELDSGN